MPLFWIGGDAVVIGLSNALYDVLYLCFLYAHKKKEMRNGEMEHGKEQKMI